MKDPIVEEVRKHRKEHTQKHHGELSGICADLRRIQETSGHEVVHLAPGRLKAAMSASQGAKARD